MASLRIAGKKRSKVLRQDVSDTRSRSDQATGDGGDTVSQQVSSGGFMMFVGFVMVCGGFITLGFMKETVWGIIALGVSIFLTGYVLTRGNEG